MRGMQTDNNVFIRFSTLSALKEEIILFGSRDLLHYQKPTLKEVSFNSKVPCASQDEILIYRVISNSNRLERNYMDRKKANIKSTVVDHSFTFFKYSAWLH